MPHARRREPLLHRQPALPQTPCRRRRGLQTALDELASDGPSAFKDPVKVVEYVMLNLQHGAGSADGIADGVAEAFRFTAPPAGKQSFVSGAPLSAERISWRRGVVIEGYVSGSSLGWPAFTEELRTSYALLLGCACWSFSVLHPHTFEPLFREGANGFAREYVLEVDGTPVAFRLIYDWGSWCYLVYSVEVLDGREGSSVAGAAFVAADAEGVGHQGKRAPSGRRGASGR